MALSSKSRSNKRPSSTSYASTLTTLVFIALCVLGVWMLSSNSVVTPKTRSRESTTTRTAIDNSESNAEDKTTSKSTEESLDTTTTTNNNNNNNNSQESTETITNTSEDSSESTTKSQDQKETPSYGDNPGHLPDDAIKNDAHTNANNDPQKQEGAQLSSEEGSLTQKQVPVTNEGGSDNDQKIHGSEKVEQSTSTVVSEGSQKDENQEQSTESRNANAGGENQEQSSGGEQGVQSFDTREGSKSNEEEENEKQLREDKGEIAENEQKQEQNEGPNVQDENQDTEKPKAEKKRRKSSKTEATKSPQADGSQGEKERQKDEPSGAEEVQDSRWHLCNVTAGADFIPCLDNEKYLKYSHRKHYEHRERHCPEDAPSCLVPLSQGYKIPIQWPSSRDKIWYHNVPHTKLAEVKGHQNWVKLTGEFLTFPGGGTQFIHGALHYIDFLQQAEAGIAWGKHTRVILDVGCGVGSFGGYLFERDVIAMSFAPKDEHEAQVQFALERGIPAISAVMGTQRLQFPSRVFDLVHCARCRVPWHEDGGLLLLELNRVLRPGGYFVWSATPVYQTLKEDVEIWKQMTSLTKAMCWELVNIKNDTLNQVGAAFYRKPISNECYEQRGQNEPPMCKDDDDPNAAWYVPLQACMHKLPVGKAERGTAWPEVWPSRLHKAPYWLNNSQVGIYGKPFPQDFAADNERWKNVVDELSSIGVSWSNVRNVMDMRAVYGGFAAALRDLQVWVFNVVNIDSPDTLPIIYERGLIGIYHDWCESFSTYPRTYDLLHADHLFSKLKNRCKLVPVIAEVDRIVRPGGNLIVRDESSATSEVENLLKSLHWEITLSKGQEGVLFAKKGNWRPTSFVELF